MIGQTISHYKIIEKLGEGGMGVVYKAEDTTLDRFVALKFLPESLHVGDQEKARFLQEAKAAAALNHPNICSVIAIEQDSGRMFIVMEFVEGSTLRERMRSVSLKQAVEIGIQLADGLSAAHDKGIVHRDIKPENIMVRKDGIAQIMDFGLAKLRGNQSKISRLTKEGSTIGTIGYMSPEQVQGQDVDHRSDIFSLGVLLYELMTGELPFKGVHETALLYEIVNVDAVPMSAVKPGIDPALDAVVLECLVKEPSERYQSVAEVAKELRRVKRESTRQRTTRTMVTRTVEVRPGEQVPAARPGRRYLWPAVSAALAAALLMVAWSPWRTPPSMPVMRFPIDLPLTAPLVGGAATLAIAPDGSSIVYLAEAGGVPQLFFRPINQFTALPIPGTENAFDPFYSPDGRWLGYFTPGVLKKVPVHGGAPVEICRTEGFPRGAYWSADDRIWYGNINQVVFCVPASGGQPVHVTRMDTANREISHRFPQLLPDGKTVIFTVKQNNITSFDDAIIAAENTQTHERKVLIRGGSYARYLPTGHLLYARGQSIYGVPFDADALEVQGVALPVIDGGMLNPQSGQANFATADNGTLAYVPLGPVGESDSRIIWVNRDGSTTALLDTVRPYGPCSLSPDGQRLAVTIRAANDDIWIYHIGRQTLTRLTFGGGNSDLPIWLPDGGRVLYYSERGTLFNTFVKPWDGSGNEAELVNARNPEGTSPAACSPDGRTLAFTRDGDIWIMSLDGDQKAGAFVQSPAAEAFPSFSPDGRWLSYTSDESGRNEVYVVPFPKRGGKWQISTGGGILSAWPPRTNELLYVEGKRVMKVDITSTPGFDFSAPRKLYDLPPAWNGSIDFTRDGKRAVVGINMLRQVSATQVNVVVGWFDELEGKFRQGTK